jgi:hypothetical protein
MSLRVDDADSTEGLPRTNKGFSIGSRFFFLSRFDVSGEKSDEGKAVEAMVEELSSGCFGSEDRCLNLLF